MKALPITCVICGKETASEIATTVNVHLLGRTVPYARREFACSSCGESFTTDEQGDANERAERSATCAALATIGPLEMRRLRELVALTQTEFENALGLGSNTVARWETGQRPIPAYIKNVIRLVALHPTTLLLLRDQDLPRSERVGAPPLAGTIERVTEYMNPYESPKTSSPSLPPTSQSPAALALGDEDFSVYGALNFTFPDAKRAWKKAA